MSTAPNDHANKALDDSTENSLEPFNFSVFDFHPVIVLPKDYEVFDFTESYDPNRERMAYGIGKYNEKRAGMYTSELFAAEDEKVRNVHIGIDIAAPLGTDVHAVHDGEIFLAGVNSADGDYGGTLITKHRLGGRDLYALYGHLSHRSLEGKMPGQKISKGEVIAWVGPKEENGGWNPHLHFQLSWKNPDVCDLPGVVSVLDREEALKIYPDPRLVLGKLY